MSTIEFEVPTGVPVEAARETVALLSRHHAVLRRVSEVLAEQGEPLSPAVLAQLGRVEEAWRRIETRWGMLDADQVTRLTGGNPEKARAHAANLRRRKGVLAVARGGGLRYPGFQFDAQGRVRPGWAEVVRVLTESQWSPEEIALWATAPTGWLDGRVPVQTLDTDPDAVLAAARAVAEGTAA